jgi:CRISPR-associated protein Csm3
MKLKSIKRITGTIHLLSGLRIGANRDLMGIGDVDNPVIRNPLSNEPYIPGSSLKGKMRSLIEWSLGGDYIENSSENHVFVSHLPTDPVNRVFGVAPTGKDVERIARLIDPSRKDTKEVLVELARKRGPTRLILRDAYLTESSKKILLERTAERGSLYSEVKQEVFIPRLGGDANPRTMERVPAGAEFGFEMSYRVLDMKDDGVLDEQLFNDVVLRALSLLQLDALGGSSSRGYGQLRFDHLMVDGVPVALPSALVPA